MQDAEGRDEELLAMLKQHEGERRNDAGHHVAYDDATGLPIKPGTHVAGHVTIGYGHNAGPGNGVPERIAQRMLEVDIEAVREGLDRQLPWWRRLPRKQRLALVDMGFNLGVPGLMQFKRMLSALHDRDYDTAAAEALDSRWATQVGERRVETVTQLLRSGDG